MIAYERDYWFGGVNLSILAARCATGWDTRIR